MDQSAEPRAFSYDRVAYPSVLLPDQSPDRLCVSALLHGLRSADPTSASVLEIGCGTGLNLLAHAAAMPGSTVAGFDLSQTAIERGRELAAAAGLDHVDLHVGDILTYPRDGRQFDYIVCHGVLSWVPEPVRQSLIELIAARLAPGGVAYISFECLPAAAEKTAIVRFLRRGFDERDTVEAAAAKAERTIATLSRNQRASSPLHYQLEVLAQAQPWRNAPYFYHDWLAEHYAPIDLEAFIATAASHNLRIAGSASNYDVEAPDLDDDGLELLASFGDDPAQRLLALEMLYGPHAFHRALLIRTDAPPPPIEDGFRLLRYAFEGWRREEQTDGGPAISYGISADNFVTTNHPASIAVFEALIAARPNELSYADLLARTGVDAATLDDVLRGIGKGYVVVVHASPQPYVAEPGETPRVTGLTRVMLHDENRAVTLRGVAVDAGQPETSVCLQLCDGTRTRTDIAAAMGRHFGRVFPPQLVDAAIAAVAPLRIFTA